MRAIICSIAVFAPLVLAAGLADAEENVVRFHVEFTEMRESGPMRIPVRRTVDVALRGGNQISATEDAGNKTSRRRQTDSTFGESYRMFSDRRRQGEWRVDTSDRLVRRSRGRTDTEILVLKINAGQSCEVGIGYVLLPGETVFFRHGHFFDRISAQGITCRIVQAGG